MGNVDMSITLRRHHYARMKKKRARELVHIGWSPSMFQRMVAIRAVTGTTCSCDRCGNVRRIVSGLDERRTRQERVNDLSFQEQIQELTEPFCGGE